MGPERREPPAWPKPDGVHLAWKTTLIASTEGNANVPGFEGVKVGLNIYKAKKEVG
jgi:hypothetical protein